MASNTNNPSSNVTITNDDFPMGGQSTIIETHPRFQLLHELVNDCAQEYHIADRFTHRFNQNYEVVIRSKEAILDEIESAVFHRTGRILHCRPDGKWIEVAGYNKRNRVLEAMNKCIKEMKNQDVLFDAEQLDLEEAQQLLSHCNANVEQDLATEISNQSSSTGCTDPAAVENLLDQLNHLYNGDSMYRGNTDASSLSTLSSEGSRPWNINDVSPDFCTIDRTDTFPMNRDGVAGQDMDVDMLGGLTNIVMKLSESWTGGSAVSHA